MAKELKRYTDTFFCPYRKMLVSLDCCIHDFVDADFMRGGICFGCSDGKRMRKEYQLDLPVFPPVVQKVKKSTSTQEEEAIAEAKRKAEEKARKKAEAEAEAKRKAEERAEKKAKAEAEAKRKAEERAKARQKKEAESRQKAAKKAEADTKAKQKAEEKKRKEKREREKTRPPKDRMHSYRLFLLFLLDGKKHFFLDENLRAASGCTRKGTSFENWFINISKLGFASRGKELKPNIYRKSVIIIPHIKVFNNTAKRLGYEDLVISTTTTTAP